ncbi:MAG TPA: hypothetical protein P5038_20530, partial [Candidatus Paceibacterota bacterium]|nr:hypothetical protein [Candidatus Paceibacterota bacterium]
PVLEFVYHDAPHRELPRSVLAGWAAYEASIVTLWNSHNHAITDFPLNVAVCKFRGSAQYFRRAGAVTETEARQDNLVAAGTVKAVQWRRGKCRARADKAPEVGSG